MDDPTKVPPTEEETIPAMREEFERLAADAFRAAGKCAPWADFDQEPRAFEEQVGKFGRLLAEAVAARPRPPICEQWTILVDLRRIGAGSLEAVKEKIGNLKLAAAHVEGGPGERPTVLFFPLLVRRGSEEAGSALLRARYAAAGELVAGVSISLGTDGAGTRTAEVARRSGSGKSGWRSSGTMAADRTAKLGPWTDGAPAAPDAAAPKITALGSSMLN